MSNIGNRIKAARKSVDLTVEEMANSIGITKGTLSKYENGLISNIPSDKIELIAKITNTTPAYLMGWEKSKKDFLPDIRTDIHTVAAHHEGDEWTPEELAEIEKFKDYVKSKREKSK